MPTDGPRLDGYTISSPCEPNGSGELKLGGGQGWGRGDVNQQPSQVKRVLKILYNWNKNTRGGGGGGGGYFYP